MSVKSTIAAAMTVWAVCAFSSAAPAPWYKWRSTLDGSQFCAQHSPGHAWIRLPTAYKDARCEQPANPS